MNKYRLSFDVENVGPVQFDVTKDTYEKISTFCKQKYPEISWDTSSQ